MNFEGKKQKNYISVRNSFSYQYFILFVNIKTNMTENQAYLYILTLFYL